MQLYTCKSMHARLPVPHASCAPPHSLGTAKSPCTLTKSMAQFDIDDDDGPSIKTAQVRSFSTHGQQSAAKGNAQPLSRALTSD
jgi:hypothetical protein